MEFHSRTAGALLEKEVMPNVGRTDRGISDCSTAALLPKMSGDVARRLRRIDVPTLFSKGAGGPHHHAAQMEGGETHLSIVFKGLGGWR